VVLVIILNGFIVFISVDEANVPTVNNTWNNTNKSENKINPEIVKKTSLHENSERWKEESNNK
jgi:hypothetical protein